MSAPKLTLTATSHAFLLFGMIAFYRDLADAMHAAEIAHTPVESAEIGLWRTKLDTLTNAVSDSFDDFADVMRECGHHAPLAWGTVIQREEP